MDSKLWLAKLQQSVSTAAVQSTDDDLLNNGNCEKIETSAKSNDNHQSDQLPDDLEMETDRSNITISEKAKQTIQVILEEIKSLTQAEQFLLYLKLPAEVSNVVDPFRQPLNPLGSRPEIYRTISWIKTHLEEDPKTSLPKQEVYEAYVAYSKDKNIKPLSQADFGKVMKQVYPKVVARRLGTRGKSRYCYSGLTKRVKLMPPSLPDLGDKPMSTEATCSQSNLMSAAWIIVRNWSHKQLGYQFPSLQSLAYYLIVHHEIGAGTEAANTLTSVVAESHLNAEEIQPKNGNKHREMQLQLQRKIQQKNEVNKERKRKIQSPKSDQKTRGKKSKLANNNNTNNINNNGVAKLETSPTLGSNATISSECSTSSNSTSPTGHGKPICDKSLDFTQLPALPDFNSFQKGSAGGDTAVAAAASAIICGPDNKMPIPRLQPPPPPPSHQNKVICSGAAKNAKYKTIQPRLPPCDIASYNLQPQAAEHRSQDVNSVNRFKEIKCSEDNCDVPDFPLTRERLNSISNVDKDAMDEYLGTNNSQHDEELSKYFNNNVKEAQETKLSTLRLLLEQNLTENPSNESIKMASAPILSYLPVVNNMNSNPAMHNVRRRVSFETPQQHDDTSTVPPSPNTRRKNFSFMPISPGPQSPKSKCSSANASPFVSPRNTPVPRTKLTVKPIKLEDLDEKNYVPSSAPVSPMLKKILNSNYANQLSLDMYRSQSVPLHQLRKAPFELEENLNPTDFNEIDPIPESDSDNVKRILSALDEQQTVFPDSFVENILEIPAEIQMSNGAVFYEQMAQHSRHMSRSLSMDVDYVSKINQFRSVPSTPLPFGADAANSSRSYPSTPLTSADGENFSYNVNGDCLLNGQRIRPVDEGFVQAGTTSAYSNLNDNNIDHEFTLVENGSGLMDENLF